MPALRSFCSAGSPRLTTVLLINAMLEAMTMAARIHGAARRVQTAVEAVARMTPSSQGSCVVNVLIENSRDLPLTPPTPCRQNRDETPNGRRSACLPRKVDVGSHAIQSARVRNFP